MPQCLFHFLLCIEHNHLIYEFHSQKLQLAFVDLDVDVVATRLICRTHRVHSLRDSQPASRSAANNC